MNENFQKLTIKDNFMFTAVMSDPDSCKELLELILDIRIIEIRVVTERSMSYHPEYNGKIYTRFFLKWDNKRKG